MSLSLRVYFIVPARIDKLILILWMLSACLAAQQIPTNMEIQDSVLASVGPKKITVREFLTSYEFGPAYPKRQKDSKKYHLNLMINEKLLALDGTKRGFCDSSFFKEPYAETSSDVNTEQLYRYKIIPRVTISESELNEAMKSKNTEISFRWIYSDDKSGIKSIYQKLLHGGNFDSLFSLQLNDSTFADERGMTIDKFRLWLKNPSLAKAADSLKPGAISRPVEGVDGWYIVRIDSVNNIISMSESEQNTNTSEITSVLTKRKMDLLSDIYVDSLLKSNYPVISGPAYHIVRAYAGRYVLDHEVFNTWRLEKQADEAVMNLPPEGKKNMESVILVSGNNISFTINDFINWLRPRLDYIKFNSHVKKEFSAQVEGLIWRMVRDRLLIAESLKEKTDTAAIVKEQCEWWQDKILFALVRDELKSSITLTSSKEIKASLNPEMEKEYSKEVTAAIYRRLLKLRQEYLVSINDSILQSTYVQDENNPKASDMYFVKKGGIYPRPAFPTIDLFWQVF